MEAKYINKNDKDIPLDNRKQVRVELQYNHNEKVSAASIGYMVFIQDVQKVANFLEHI